MSYFCLFLEKKIKMKGIENENMLYKKKLKKKQYIISFAKIYPVSYELQLHTKVSECYFLHHIDDQVQFY